jgi:hypothetical protein
MYMRVQTAGVLLTWLLGGVGLAGQSAAPQTGSGSAVEEAAAQAGLGLVPGRPTVRPTRTDTRPDIDGSLDDELWQRAAKLTEFTQQAPLDGAPATEETEVWVAYDDDNLYFAFYLHYEDPSIMRANRVDRDRAARDDLMTIYLDTFLDQQRSYDFDVNGYGVQGDGIIDASRRRGGPIPFADRSWDTLFDTAAQIVEDGYIAEMAIPFKSLRYPQRGSGVPHRWGFQIVREVKQKSEENIVWAPMSRDVDSFLSQFGVMEGMTDLSRSRNLEILPTFTAINFGSLDEDTGSFDIQNSPEAGVNFKYGLTSNLTADFTLNPDFSQIESDRPQIEVNQRFPLFFPELRPFFIEGAEIFDMGGPVRFVHTRTIVDPMYGAKLTGKAGGTTLGVLAANDRAPGKTDLETAPGFDQSAQTFIGRVKQDLYSESYVGAIFTNREFAGSHSRLAGADGNFRLDQTHNAQFRTIATQHRDLDGVDRSGHMLDVNLAKNGRNLGYFLGMFEVSPDFRTDVGFVRRTDQRKIAGNVSYRWWPESWLINWGPKVGYGRLWDFDDVLEDENLNVGVNFNQDMERFGGIDFDKTRMRISGGVNSSRRFEVSANVRRGDKIFYDAESPYLGRSTEYGINTTLRPVPRLQSRLSLDTSRFVDPVRDDEEIFNVKIFRAFTTYQFTDRMLLRNIIEYDTFDKAFGFNLLATYRVNAGTVFFLGYDDHYQQAGQLFDERDRDGDGIPDPGFDPSRFEQTNRAFFMKIQYLFRY